jgi:hypothetical protein
MKSQESKPGQFRDNFGTPPWESRDKEPFRCGCGGITQRILYGGRWWLPLSSGHGESSESVLHVAYPNTKNGSEGVLTNLLVSFLMHDQVTK